MEPTKKKTPILDGNLTREILLSLGNLGSNL